MIDKTNYLKISDFATKAGVSRQTIYNDLTGKLTDFVKVIDGIKMLDNERQRSIEKHIDEISKIKCRKVKSALGLDGYSHTVVINGRSFYWWCEPVSNNAKLLNELVSAVFSFLPEEFRRIEQ